MVKGSYFPNEDWDFSEEDCKLDTFVEMLKSRGCVIAPDWHIRSAKGGMMSKLTRNGYWLTMASFNRTHYYFCEHRVIYTWLKGHIPAGMQVNHKDYNRANNNIDNLELLSPKENNEYSACHQNPAVGERSPKAKFTDQQAAAIKFLAKSAGWSNKTICDFVGTSDYNVTRIVNGKRYPHVPTPGDLLSVYPCIVDFTRNLEVGPVEELKNYAMGLCGETGELVDLIKKALFHGKEIQPVDVLLELGDILYYLVAISRVLGFDFDMVSMNNNVKLMERYPHGFNCEDSNNRVEDVVTNQSKENNDGDNR